MFPGVQPTGGIAALLGQVNATASATADQIEASRKQAEALGGISQGFNQPFSLAMQKTLEAAKGVRGPFSSFGEFAKCVKHREHPGNASQEMVTHSKGMMDKWQNEFVVRQKANGPTGIAESFTGADGGYLVPPEFAAQILMRTYANDLLSRCTVLPIGSNSIKIPAINETNRADGSRFGGVQAYWRREAGSVSATKPSIMDVDLTLDSLMLFIRVTQEMLEDTGGALEVLLTSIAAQEIAFKLGDALVNGDGVTKPLGLMNSPAKIAVTKVASQPAATIVPLNVLNMFSQLHLSCWGNSVFLFDQSILPQLQTMTIGSAGAQLVVWMPPGGLSSAPYGTLLGRPMIPVEFCQQLGTEGDIILADMTQMLVATKGGISTAVSMHLYFDTNEMAFRFTIRLDAKPWWIKALTPKNNGPKQSFCTTLQTRS